MISSKLSRALPRVAASTSTSSPAALSPASTSQGSARRLHQRRHSSSKTSSCPPDNSSPKAAQAAKSAESTEPHDPLAAGEKGYRKKLKTNVKAAQAYRRQSTPYKRPTARASKDATAGLPSVPQLHGMQVADLRISAFYSLHRPLSLATGIPPPSTPEAFSSIFNSRPTPHPWANGNSAERKPEDVIYTLHNTISNLETKAQAAEDEGIKFEIISESPSNNDGIKHLDGPPPRLKSLEELVAQFTPFRAPPPPQPFPDPAVLEKKTSSSRRPSSRGPATKKHTKTFTTVLTIHESTDEHNRKTWSATSTPIVRRPDPARSYRARRQPMRAVPISLPPLLREIDPLSPIREISAPSATKARQVGMWRRRLQMRLISVKRQRKLKMKKHKYKKLMKRTRNLRRKLDRN